AGRPGGDDVDDVLRVRADQQVALGPGVAQRLPDRDELADVVGPVRETAGAGLRAALVHPGPAGRTRVAEGRAVGGDDPVVAVRRARRRVLPRGRLPATRVLRPWLQTARGEQVTHPFGVPDEERGAVP